MADPTAAIGLDDDIAEDFRILGFEIEPDQPGTSEEDVLGIWQENWPSVQAFLRCQTQWHGVSNLAGIIWTGINYASLETVMQRLKSPEHVFDDVQHMEAKALEAFGEVKA